MNDPAEGFTAVVRRYYPQVLAYALRRVDEAWAHDVVADTFLTAWRHVDRLPPDPLPWLYRTAGNTIANQARTRRRQLRLAGRMAEFAATTTDDHAEAVTGSMRLRAALAELPDIDREALLLVAWEGLDHQSAARASGCSSATFRVRLYRARRRLSRLLSEEPSPDAHAPLAHVPAREI